MTDIVITEFMDEAAVAMLSARYSVHHDPDLFGKPEELARLVGDVPALIVRNQTQVRGDVLAAATKLKVVGRLDARPRHPKAMDRSDPLYPARSKEVTTLWRLAAT